VDAIRSAFMKGHEMPVEEVMGLAVHCTFLFLTSWVAMRVAAGYRNKVTRLEVHAMRDPLTGLPNRRAFQEKVHQEIERAERNGWPLTLLVVDLDHFKRVNDKFGHPFGDAVLGQSAQLLRDATGALDHLGRIGGEEFAVAAFGADPTHGGDLASKIVRRFRSHAWERMKPGFSLTCSVGVAVLDPRSLSGDAEGKYQHVLAQADRALYQMKQNGRDGFHVAGTPMPAAPRTTTSSSSATPTAP
jgi:diguanylate cyclase (GGDEF)-like protein